MDACIWGKLASVLAPSSSSPTSYSLREASLPYSIYGAVGIDEWALRTILLLIACKEI